MPNYTENVGLRLITRPDEDNENFNTQSMLNDNWDKIDDAIGDLPSALTDMGLDEHGSVADGLNKVYKSAGSWNVALIQESTTLQFPEYVDEDIHVLLFGAGGGSGGVYKYSSMTPAIGAGGGGGHLEEFDYTINHSSSYPIVIGGRGANGVSDSDNSLVTSGYNGGASEAFGHTANGGEGGKRVASTSETTTGNGGSGGTGGGAGGSFGKGTVAYIGDGGSGSYGGGGGGYLGGTSVTGTTLSAASHGGSGGTHGGRGGDYNTTPTTGDAVSMLDMPIWMRILFDVDMTYGLSGEVSNTTQSGKFSHMSSASYTGKDLKPGKAGGGYGGKGGIGIDTCCYGGGGGYFQNAEYGGGGGYGPVRGSYNSGTNGGGGFMGIAAQGAGGVFVNGSNAQEQINATSAGDGICVIFYRIKGGRPE